MAGRIPLPRRARSKRSGSGLKTLSATHIAAKRTYVRECDGCGHVFARKGDCPSCGKTEITIFDSQGEFNRWRTLLILQRVGTIRDLRRQVRYPLAVNLTTIGHIVPDFVYFDVEKQQPIVEDYKGALTDLFNWKRRHFEAQYGMPIRVTTG